MRRTLCAALAAAPLIAVLVLGGLAYAGSAQPDLPRLGAIRADVCNAPRDSIQRRLCADVPQVFDPSLGDWQRTSLLRDWAYAHIDASNSSRTYDTRDFTRRPASSIFDDFAKDKAGV